MHQTVSSLLRYESSKWLALKRPALNRPPPTPPFQQKKTDLDKMSWKFFGSGSRLASRYRFRFASLAIGAGARLDEKKKNMKNAN
jgi:hypothetical protein